MVRCILALLAIGVLFFLTACATLNKLNEPPATIYPDRNESPGNYKLDPFG
jgi:hypothetical protein